jgi:hypothetical protein
MIDRSSVASCAGRAGVAFARDPCANLGGRTMPETGSRTSLAATLAVSLLAPAAVFADPVRNGQPQVMKAHRPPHFVPPSLSPAATLHPAAAGLAKVYSGTPIDVTAYHCDGLRTGWNPRETDLTTTTVASANFGLLTTLNVDGNVFSQPLLVSSFVMPDGSTHNVLIIATGHNSVYAYDAQTYALLWHINLGPSQSSADVGCGDVEPEYGIMGIPFTDLAEAVTVRGCQPIDIRFEG